jgi:hypothetical protein
LTLIKNNSIVVNTMTHQRTAQDCIDLKFEERFSDVTHNDVEELANSSVLKEHFLSLTDDQRESDDINIYHVRRAFITIESILPLLLHDKEGWQSSKLIVIPGIYEIAELFRDISYFRVMINDVLAGKRSVSHPHTNAIAVRMLSEGYNMTIEYGKCSMTHTSRNIPVLEGSYYDMPRNICHEIKRRKSRLCCNPSTTRSLSLFATMKDERTTFHPLSHGIRDAMLEQAGLYYHRRKLWTKDTKEMV